MLTLNKQQLQDLETYLLELPAKFANPILNFLATIKNEQALKQESEKKPKE